MNRPAIRTLDAGFACQAHDRWPWIDFAERDVPDVPDVRVLDAGMALLGALVAESVATGVHRLHVETETGQCRVRLRRVEGLQERRHDPDCGLGEAFAHLGRRLGLRPPADARFLCRVGTRTWLMRIDALETSTGGSWLLAPLAHSPQAPMLDELVDEAGALSTLRSLLAVRHGLVLLSGDDPWALAPLATAVAQTCIAPDRKVLRVEPIARHPLPGAVQIGLEALAPERREATCRALLSQDADVIVADAGLPARIGPLLDSLAAEGRLVVRVTGACDARSALAALRGDGADGPWLAEHLLGLVRVDGLRLLCEACRRPAENGTSDTGAAGVGRASAERHGAHGPKAGTSRRVGPALSPARRLLADSLARFARSDGCPSCHHTGIGELRSIVDVLPLDAKTRDDLRAEAFGSASLRLEQARRGPRLAHALAQRGLVAIDEAARLGRD